MLLRTHLAQHQTAELPEGHPRGSELELACLLFGADICITLNLVRSWHEGRTVITGYVHDGDEFTYSISSI